MTTELGKRSRMRVATCFFVWALLLPSALMAQSDAAEHALSQLESGTSLNREGLSPWHLQMSFDLFDLNGKKKESGTIEEWWTAPGRRKVVVSSPSFSIPNTSGKNQWVGREAYLVDLLLQQVVHPVPDYSRYKGLSFATKQRMFGKVTLSCISVHSKADYESFGWPEYCSEPNTNTLRVRFDKGEFSTTRNRLGTFRNTSVSMRNAISYGDKTAITGEVTKLEGYVPEGSGVPDETPADAAQEVPGVVTGGGRLTFVQPVYPEMEKIRRAGGSVVLCAVISREGDVTFLDPVASPGENFSEAAVQAVRKWTYKPWMLNGKPTEVNTTVTVNFAMYK